MEGLEDGWGGRAERDECGDGLYLGDASVEEGAEGCGL